MAGREEGMEDAEEEYPPPFVKDRTKDYAKSLLHELRLFQQNSELTDISVELSDGRSLRCHRILLAAASPYFKGVLNFGPAVPSFDMKFLDATIVEEVIKYIYSGHLSVSFSLMHPFIMACDFLQMAELKEECADFLMNNLSPRLGVFWYPISCRIGLSNLMHACLESIAIYFAILTDVDELMDLDNAELQSIIKHKSLQVSSEDLVLEVVIKWVMHDKQNREDDFERLIQFVRINQCSNALLACIGKQRNPETRFVKQAIKKRMTYLHAIKDKAPDNIPQPRASIAMESMFLAGGKTYSDYGPASCRYIWCAAVWPGKSEFDKMTRLPWDGDRYEYGITLVPCGFVITGGRYDVSMGDCLIFNFRHLEWNPLTLMQTYRHGHVSLTYKMTTILVIGGQRICRTDAENEFRDPLRTEQLSSIEYLDLLEMKWEHLTTMPDDACNEGVVCSEKLYLMNNKSKRSDLLEYDFEADIWNRRAALPKESKGSRLLNIMERLYVIGGYKRLFHTYSPEGNVWTALERPTLKIESATVVFSRGSVFYGGGQSEEGPNWDFDEYNFKEGSWQRSYLILPGTFMDSQLFSSKHFSNFNVGGLR